MRELVASVGGKHNAKIKQRWTGTWPAFVKTVLSKVPETMDKASVGWICGAEFDPPYRDSENFVARHFLTLDYDHIGVDDLPRLVDHFRQWAVLAYTTWSHSVLRPRLRVWLPLSRSVSYDEFQAVSRSVAASAPGGIELAARESHVPSQYMFRPAIKPFDEFSHWEETKKEFIDVDRILADYLDWTDRSQWPHRMDGDGVHSEGSSVDPRTKPGVVGAFCRAFSISGAIERFDLPYERTGTEGRWTYTAGSRPEGAIVYDEDTKLHSHHDTDPARGQHNAYDLVRLHLFGSQDDVGGVRTLAELPSSKRMQDLALHEGAVQRELQVPVATEFDDLGEQPEDGSVVQPNSDKPDRADSGVVGEIPGFPKRLEPGSTPYCDQRNAFRLQRKFGGKLVSVGGSMYYWTGKYWKNDEHLAKTKCLHPLSAIIKAEADKLEEDLQAVARRQGRVLSDDENAQIKALNGWAARSGNVAAMEAALKILRDGLNFEAENLNKAAHLFSCDNGIIDLRTGELMPHDAKHFITAASPVKYSPLNTAPRFQKWLRDIFNGDEETIAFLKRWLGYCITGDVREHKMVFHLGPGRNGKGTLMDVLQAVLGNEYYATSPPNLLAYEIQGASPEIARLLGKRMVTISESEHETVIKEAMLKQLTGGDRLSARMLFKEYFEFQPTHKLQVFTNAKPKINGTDFAIRERMLLLDYPNKYGTAEQLAEGEVTHLKDTSIRITLPREAPGVLTWLVEGAVEWYAGGLREPEGIIQATKEFYQSQDKALQFVRERIVVDPAAYTPLSGLGSVFSAYTGWCREMNIRTPWGRDKFVQELKRVLPIAKEVMRQANGLLVPGFTGFKLTDAIIDE